MNKIFSARIDEEVIRYIGYLAKKMKTSKKEIIETAVREYAEKINQMGEIDILEESFGIRHREETPEETVEEAKKTFREAMKRHA